MHKFDVKYTFDNYYEYYKFVLIKQRMVRDIIFCILFCAIGVYFLVDTSENTSGIFIPIFSFAMGIVSALTGYIMLPITKKQLKNRQSDIDRTHIVVTFSQDSVIYENLTEKKDAEKNIKSETSTSDVNDSALKDETPTSNENDNALKDEKVKDENTFELKYENFMVVRESKTLFMFYLDRQTVVILPKETYLGGDNFDSFKELILSKVPAKRVKFLKEKK